MWVQDNHRAGFKGLLPEKSFFKKKKKQTGGKGERVEPNTQFAQTLTTPGARATHASQTPVPMV